MWSFSPRDDQQRAAIRVLGVDLRLRPRVEVRRRRLEQRLARRRDRVRLVQLLRLVLGRRRSRTRTGTGRTSAGRRGCGCAGCRAPASADLSAENGSGRTPRNGAGSIATETAESPRPATICVSRPPKECPITAGFLSACRSPRRSDRRPRPIDLSAKTSGFAFASSTVFGIVRPARRERRVARLGEDARPSDPSCSASSQRPWMNTTGVLPEAFACVDLFLFVLGDD